MNNPLHFNKGNYVLSRKILLDRVTMIKADLVREINSDGRNWGLISALYAEYKDLQQGADLLGGHREDGE